MSKNLEPQSSDEKVARTCIGRAYYAAFLSARETIRRYYPTQLASLRRKGDAHQFVRSKLIDRGKPNIANKLLDLSDKRNRADYELSNYSSVADQQREVTKSIQLCENIISLLSSV
jgi:hypothetical protein